MKGAMRVHYDVEGDFLEISVGKPTLCYAEEVESGVFIRKDEKTNEVKSIGILSFKRRSKTDKIKDFDLTLPVTLNMATP